MFDFRQTNPVLNRINSKAENFLNSLKASEVLKVKHGKVQLMIYHPDIGKLGGLSTKPRGQYILAFKAYGRIKSARLRQLGFHMRHRSDGTPYWYQQGHNDFRGLGTALEEMTT